jgi:hypothetical protein
MLFDWFGWCSIGRNYTSVGIRGGLLHAISSNFQQTNGWWNHLG